MKISASNNIEGYEIQELKDIVFGTASSSEGAHYKQLALKKLSDAAEKIGGNAVINVRFQIYSLEQGLLEATAYGNAVVTKSIYGSDNVSNQKKVKLEAYMPKPKVPSVLAGKIFDAGGYKFVVCPECGTKYKVDKNEKGELCIKGFEDVDDSEPGLQVFCLKCGTKFTVPEF